MPKRLQVALLIETSNSYARGLLRGIHAYLREGRRWSIYLVEQGRGAPPPEGMQRWHGDGIIARVETPAIAQAIRAKHLPTVNVSTAGLLPKLPCVIPDNEAVARLAFDHLRERGFKSMAFCGDARREWRPSAAAWERQGYFARMAREAGCRLSTYPPANGGHVAPTCWDDEEQQLTAWVRQLTKPCGVMAFYDMRGLQLLEICRTAGVAVPDEVAVVGAGNDELLCELSEPPMSSVAPHGDAAGYAAASLLERMMAGETIAGMHLIKPTGLVIRQSSDVLAVKDPDVSRAVRFIRDHGAEGIKVGDLLRAARVSRRVLEARFKKLLGHSPHDEILRVQLERVRQLLEETDLPLKVITERTGFRHIQNLTAVFKRHVGQTPGEYRAKHRGRAAFKIG